MNDKNSSTLTTLLSEIRQCNLCKAALHEGVNPIVQADTDARVLIIGQAPGIRVHKSGVPWDDASGDRLRNWLKVSKKIFYGPKVAIMPMGFCYPGKGKSGDLPPRRECAPAWHDQLLKQLPNIQLTLLIGQYAQRHYLTECEKTLTATVKNFRDYLPDFVALPHPSPRNNIWLKNNPWFESDVLPALQSAMARA